MKPNKKNRKQSVNKNDCLTLKDNLTRRGLNGTVFTSINGYNINDNIYNSMYSDTDPDGSYTGIPRDTNEVPVQDADDL